jgi:Ca2+-binding EF-hand superfamily protein
MLRNVVSRTSSRILTVSGARAAPLPCGGTAKANFSTGNKKLVDIRRDEQRNVWDAYLLGSISSDSVFRSLDLNKSGTISVEEINYFMDSVHKANVSEEAFNLLQKLGEDHALDAEEFERWLCMGTELRRVNPALEGILDNLDDSSSSSDDEEEKGSSSATDSNNIVDARRGLQQLVWETFLSTGEHGPDLFKMIDLNRNGRISVEEISYFMDSVGGKGVDASKFSKLKALGEDHEVNSKEFMAWLTLATGIDHAGGDIGGGPVEDAGGEHSSPVRDNADGCTPGQW